MMRRMSRDRFSEAGERLKDARLRALATTTLAIVWTTDPDGSIQSENPSWAAFTGQTRKQYEIHGWLEAIHPEDRQRLFEEWRSALRQTRRFAADYRLRRHDGEYRDVTAEGAPVFEGKRVVEWVGYCIDVTDRHRAEAALTQSEARLRFFDELGVATRSIVDATQVMGITARLLGEHLGATRTAYADVEADSDRFHIRNDWSIAGVASSAGTYSLTSFGPQAVSMLRQSINLVIHDVDRELGDEGGGRMFNAIGIKAIICAPLVKEGRLVAMMAVHQSHPRRWGDKEVAIVSEVVERCWAHIERVGDTAKLLEQDRHKDDFLATLAHELRNPLAPLRYASEILRLAPPGGNRAKQAQDMIDRQVGHMARLIDDLLDLSRVNRGLINLKLEPVGLRGLLEQAVETSRPALEAARHRLEVSLPDEDVFIIADPARIVQIVGNLLNNAAKYTPDGGRIRVAAWKSDGHALIEVVDNGIGIPPNQQGRLFQMFTQLHHTASRAQGGLGIGLALVKTLVQLHGGDVRVFSKGLDEGSAFTVELPLQQRQRLVPDASAALIDRGSRDSAGVRVLVVEDNEDGLTSLLTLLETMGFEAVGAADGPAGLEAAERFLPDAVLLDLGLPGMDGFAVARALRAHPRHAGVVLVALTGWGSEADQKRTAATGFDRHLTKPVEPQTLRDTLKELTARTDRRHPV